MKRKINIFDKISLSYLIFKKEYARIYRFKYNKHLERKIKKLINKRETHLNKWQRKYDSYLKDYNRYIAYLKYKGLNSK